MGLNSITRSQTIYEASKQKSAEGDSISLSEKIQAAIDLVVEYPGSKKGEYGMWRFPDWVEAKVEQIITHNGRERK